VGLGGPLLVGGGGAVPDLQAGTVGGAGSGGVQTAARAGVDELRTATRPRLRAGAVAVIELDRGAVGGTGGGDVQALAQRPDRTVGADRPLLSGGAVAGPE